MQRQIMYEGEPIVYDVVHKKVKNVNFHVQSDLSVWVSAPKRLSGAELDQMVLAKAPWIRQALDQIRAQAENRLIDQLTDGGQIAFLGRALPLAVQQDGIAAWQLTEQGLLVTGCADEEAIRQQVERFYQAQRILVFEEINEQVYRAYFAGENLPKAQLKIRRLSASWGRCHVQKGVIVLNGQLIKASVACITAVMVHEYVHFLHPDHGAAFYQLLRQLLPQYDELKQQLGQQVSCRPEN